MVWFSDVGLKAYCRATADAEPVGVTREEPWKDGGVYRYIWPIEILAEIAVRSVRRQRQIDDLAGKRVQLNQWVSITDPEAIARLRAEFAGADSPVDVALLPTVNLEYLQTDHRTLIARAIADRRGQGKFRASLLQHYRGRCVITDTDVPEVLEAAHIHPYRGEHTDRIDNGLLLRADVHTLFDLYRLTVLPAGVVRVHPDLYGTDYDFDQRRLQFPVAEANRPHAGLLRWHNEQCGWLTRV